MISWCEASGSGGCAGWVHYCCSSVQRSVWRQTAAVRWTEKKKKKEKPPPHQSCSQKPSLSLWFWLLVYKALNGLTGTQQICLVSSLLASAQLWAKKLQFASRKHLAAPAFKFNPRKLLFVNVTLAESHPDDITRCSELNSTYFCSLNICLVVRSEAKGAKVQWHGHIGR